MLGCGRGVLIARSAIVVLLLRWLLNLVLRDRYAMAIQYRGTNRAVRMRCDQIHNASCDHHAKSAESIHAGVAMI